MWPHPETRSPRQLARRVHVSTFMRALTIGSIGGIPVRVHWSFLIALPLLALVFGQNVAPAAELVGVDPGSLAGPVWLWGLGLTLALFLCGCAIS